MTWTKADIKRMQAVFDLVAHAAERRLRYETPDEHRDGVNASLRTNARTIVRDVLLSLPCHHERERKASARIAARLLTEDLPPEVIVPQVTTHREIAATIRERDAQEAARLAAEEKARTPVAVPYQVDADRDRKTIAFNLRETIGRGVVEAHRATSDAFGTDTQWGDVEGLVTWQAWARPAAERRGCAEAWDRCTSDAQKLAANAEPIARLWGFACEEETLPAVLDLRGIPAMVTGLPTERWMQSLIAALRKKTDGVGVVFVTDCEAWALARCLPARVGVA